MPSSKSDENSLTKEPISTASCQRARSFNKCASVGEPLARRSLRRAKAAGTKSAPNLQFSGQLQELQRNAIAGLIVSKTQGVVRYPGIKRAIVSAPTSFDFVRDSAVLSERDSSGLDHGISTNSNHISLQEIPNTTGVVTNGQSDDATPSQSSLASNSTGQCNSSGSHTTVSGPNFGYGAQGAYTLCTAEAKNDLECGQYNGFSDEDLYDEEDDHVCGDDPEGCDCSLDLEDALVTIMTENCSLPES
ncbi:hypothetical protein SARC_06023 [Sphaeroforma arctica JP610]|uniref:Uncharacterized protein n=1 Tax=Sphaeroforma arctica JP610 TaxID=667725 RepID=A0A0L0FYH3_9EUKA|nr:hypothetical protein SARC_06023 [Sphaeroforma arctica JP610]KNC81669.1 hypothetical protein SARC_06023 [Sphaeroforma arctica JP610]|eukprot:XP_014155571.1 hypothetical protein SARC_06023 [Sphaeroforma arctica JP610]